MQTFCTLYLDSFLNAYRNKEVESAMELVDKYKKELYKKQQAKENELQAAKVSLLEISKRL